MKRGKIKMLMTKSKLFLMFKTGDYYYIHNCNKLNATFERYTDPNELDYKVVK